MRPPPAIAPWLPPLLASLLASPGCRLVGVSTLADAPVSDPIATGDDREPAARRTLQLEILFIRCTADDHGLRSKVWEEVDEQAIADDRRRSLNANGLRAGVVTGRLPAPLAERLGEWVPSRASGDDEDAGGTRRLLQVLPGRRSDVLTATRLPSLVLLERVDDEVRGGTYHDASPLLAVTAHPSADGRVRLQVTPEIMHGPVEKTWAGEDGMFRLETGQRRHRMDHLTIDLSIAPGCLLLIGPAGEAATTVGDGLLGGHGGGTDGATRLIAIRPRGRTVDPAFAVDDAAADDPDG